MQKPSRRTLLIAAAGILAAVAAVALAWGSTSGLLPDLRLPAVFESAAGEQAGGQVSGDAVPKATEQTGAPDARDPQGAPGQSGGGQGAGQAGGGAGGSGQPAGGDKGSSRTGLVLMVNWWNDTVEDSPDALEVVYGSQVVKPGSLAPHSTGSIGPFPVDKEQSLTVYPDGKGGKKYEVRLTVTKGMQANSDVDAIHIEIADSHVRILGNAIDNFDHTFER